MLNALSPAHMRECDKITIEHGTPAIELLQRAGKALFHSYPWKGKTAIICGTGNNGGDGYVLALYLHAANIPCEVILWQDRATPEGRYYLDQVRAKGIPVKLWDGGSLQGYCEVVDGLFGTGFHGIPDPSAAALIREINESGAIVISIDIPSGLSGLSGQAEAACVTAHTTIVMGSAKYGNYLGCAKDVCGKLTICDIGIPIVGKTVLVPEKGDFGRILYRRINNSHKGTYGYITILGGCPSYSGAIKLSNLGATHLLNPISEIAALGNAASYSGCGVVRLAVPTSMAPLLGQYVLESTIFSMPENAGKMIYAPTELDQALAQTAAAAVGMGWGQSSEYESILAHILSTYHGRLLIDADGLNTLAKMGEHGRELLRQTQAHIVLTPHPKEFERLSGIAVPKILSDPIRYAEEFAEQYNVTLLLKGTATTVTNGQTTYIVNRGCPGMATAGSGDVLSGIAAGLLGYHEPTPETIACAAYIAGLAGEMAEHMSNPISQTAGATAMQIPAAVTDMMRAAGTL